MAKNLTEDAVRDLARDILGLVDSDAARAGVGQLTTFNQLGFAGVADKPDGWYLPKNKADVALVLETKATRIALGKAQVDEVLKNVRIVQTQYEKVIGVLYNGEDVRVFKGEEEVKTPDKLQHVGYYLSLYTVDRIDKVKEALDAEGISYSTEQPGWICGLIGVYVGNHSYAINMVPAELM